jgi:hypothetical protein
VAKTASLKMWQQYWHSFVQLMVLWQNLNFRWRQWGPSLPGLRTLDPPLSPHRHWRKFFSGNVWEGGGQKMLKIFLLFQAILFFRKKIDHRGTGGTPEFVLLQILFFLWLKTPCEIPEPYDNPLLEKSKCRRKKEREKTPLIVDT